MSDCTPRFAAEKRRRDQVRDIPSSRSRGVPPLGIGTPCPGVWRWGGGYSTVPEQFEAIDDVVALANKGGCAVKSDGTAWCWWVQRSGSGSPTRWSIHDQVNDKL